VVAVLGDAERVGDPFTHEHGPMRETAMRAEARTIR
jgi:hypothetical protein